MEGEGFGRCASVALQRLADPPVQQPPAACREVVLDRLADQVVREAVVAHLILGEQAGCRCPLERGEHLVLRAVAHADQQRARDDAPGEGGDRERLLRAFGEGEHTLADDLPHRPGKRVARRGRVGGAQVLDEADQEEGDAAGASHDRGQHRLHLLGVGGQLAEQLLRLRL